MDTAVNQELDAVERRRYETRAVLFLMVVLGPAIAVAFVGTYGFVIWMSQLLFGPPTA